jgi:RimJ/RimL family protein N-acetyltransferase
MILHPIKQTFEENQIFVNQTDFALIVQSTVDFYGRIGYHIPWIGYIVEKNGQFVGTAAYKGINKDKTVEIAYYVLEQFQNKGIGSEICGALVDVALKADPNVRVTARTLPEENFSTRILKRNNFELLGTICDDEDGDVWEWEFRK